MIVDILQIPPQLTFYIDGCLSHRIVTVMECSHGSQVLTLYDKARRVSLNTLDVLDSVYEGIVLSRDESAVITIPCPYGHMYWGQWMHLGRA